MGCCGQRRSVLRQNSAASTRNAAVRSVPARKKTTPSPQISAKYSNRPAVTTSTPLGAAVVFLRYLETSPIQVHGPFTGRTYHFSGSQSVQAVDPRDAQALVQTRFFRRASSAR